MLRLLIAAVSALTVSSPLAGHGVPMERAAAERALAFRPFVPDGAIRATALQPPFHGGDTARNDGIAYDYAHAARAWILSEWPRRGGTLHAFAPLAVAEARCADLHRVGDAHAPRGVVWSTPRGMVLSLVPDGSADLSTIVAEWRRLVRRGACR